MASRRPTRVIRTHMFFFWFSRLPSWETERERERSYELSKNRKYEETQTIFSATRQSKWPTEYIARNFYKVDFQIQTKDNRNLCFFIVEETITEKALKKNWVGKISTIFLSKSQSFSYIKKKKWEKRVARIVEEKTPVKRRRLKRWADEASLRFFVLLSFECSMTRHNFLPLVRHVWIDGIFLTDQFAFFFTTHKSYPRLCNPPPPPKKNELYIYTSSVAFFLSFWNQYIACGMYSKGFSPSCTVADRQLIAQL